jgi:hypothetical protein
MDHRGVDYAPCVGFAHDVLYSSDMAGYGWSSVIPIPVLYLYPQKVELS